MITFASEGLSLSNQLPSKRQEEKLRKLAKDVFLNEFPNPDRKGCPDSQTIRAIAFGRVTGEEAQKWHVHAATCSPCTREYVSFRKEAARARSVRTLLIAAAAVFLFVVVGWAVLSKLGVPLGHGVVAWAEGWQPAQTDLRGHEALRGAETGPQLPPPVIPRGKLVWTIDLPVGSEPGHYDIELQQPRGSTVARASGTAILVNGLTVLNIRIDTRRAHAGACSLRVHPPQRSWSRFAIIVR
jgi:hypothetical protein